MQGLCTCEAHELGLRTSPAALESAKLINNCANNKCSLTLQNINISKNNINEKKRDVSSLVGTASLFFFLLPFPGLIKCFKYKMAQTFFHKII